MHLPGCHAQVCHYKSVITGHNILLAGNALRAPASALVNGHNAMVKMHLSKALYKCTVQMHRRVYSGFWSVQVACNMRTKCLICSLECIRQMHLLGGQMWDISGGETCLKLEAQIRLGGSGCEIWSWSEVKIWVLGRLAWLPWERGSYLSYRNTLAWLSGLDLVKLLGLVLQFRFLVFVFGLTLPRLRLNSYSAHCKPGNNR